MDFKLRKIHDWLWEMPAQGEMKVPGRIYGDEEIIKMLREEVDRGTSWNALLQIYNVAALPGIVKYSLAMSDVHPGYGFPIGGVGAFDLDKGVISVAGVGFDINCGVRTMTTQLTLADFNEEKKERLANQLFRDIPAGVGSEGEIKLNLAQIDEVLTKGAEFVLGRGYGTAEDLEYIEERGQVENCRPQNVSLKAKQRQFRQIGTLGAGNHYLEVQSVAEIYDQTVASVFGFNQDQIILSIHCGSRALGHQIGTDYLKVLEAASRKYKIPIRERELVCAPFKSPEGVQYFTAVNCGINCAFANRQALAHLVRLAFNSALGVKPETIKTFYEIGHNNVKVEVHEVDGQPKKLLIHRKGSTRAFGPGRPEVPEKYRLIGQPVIIGGTMGTHSYILHGTKQGMIETWGSACHGAGRQMSRLQAAKRWRADDLVRELKTRGIIIRGKSKAGLSEEAPGAYKDVDKVVEVMHQAGVIKKVIKMRPLIVIKG
jgi:tRNA-splicing ligase RtcB